MSLTHSYFTVDHNVQVHIETEFHLANEALVQANHPWELSGNRSNLCFGAGVGRNVSQFKNRRS